MNCSKGSLALHQILIQRAERDIAQSKECKRKTVSDNTAIQHCVSIQRHTHIYMDCDLSDSGPDVFLVVTSLVYDYSALTYCEYVFLMFNV